MKFLKHCLFTIFLQHGIRPISDTGSGDRPIEGASIKIKKMTRLYEGNTKFPKLQECAHFHYDFVELGPIEVGLRIIVVHQHYDHSDNLIALWKLTWF